MYLCVPALAQFVKETDTSGNQSKGEDMDACLEEVNKNSKVWQHSCPRLAKCVLKSGEFEHGTEKPITAHLQLLKSCFHANIIRTWAVSFEAKHQQKIPSVTKNLRKNLPKTMS